MPLFSLVYAKKALFREKRGEFKLCLRKTCICVRRICNNKSVIIKKINKASDGRLNFPPNEKCPPCLTSGDSNDSKTVLIRVSCRRRINPHINGAILITLFFVIALDGKFIANQVHFELLDIDLVT